jgi:glycosyltransferase involved in cell wall biosynthesis
MRIAVNGWFWDQLATGSGQYLVALAEWLPAVDGDHEFILVRHCAAGLSPTRGLAQSIRSTGALSPAGPANSVGVDAYPPGWQAVAVSTPFSRFSGNVAKLWFEQVTFPRLCARLGAGVALVPYWGSPFWSPCPLVVTIHDLIPRLLPLYRGGPLQRLYTGLVSLTARRAALLLTDSEAGSRDIIAQLGIPPSRVRAIHLAAGPQFRRVDDPVLLAAVHARYRLPDGPFFIYLGGFDARKNVLRLIEAYARLLGTSVPLPELVIAGKLPAADSAFAPDPRPLVARLGLSGRVHFTGWVDEADKPALYSLARAALFVSEYEGFGLPVIEAQACGCPVITAA